MSTDCGSASTLYCELCDFVQFSTYSEFHLHHLSHIRQPAVNLVKLNDSLIKKLKVACYKVNTGVARRSVNHVSPLKISLKKNQGTSQFQVIKKEVGNQVRLVTSENISVYLVCLDKIKFLLNFR